MPVATHRFVLNSPDEDVVGEVQVVTARHQDTLPDIARRFNLGYDEIVAANPDVSVWLPGEGTQVVLPTKFVLPDAPRKGVVLNLATLRLFYYPKTGPDEPPVVITHPIGIGRVGWSTPLGKTKITKKYADPSWYPPASIRKEHAAMGDPLPAVVPPGPDNPLGSHVLRLGFPRYLLHGTNKPYGVGMRVSHGCVRLFPEDIASMYEMTPVGTRVNIVNQPILAGWSNGSLYLEAHPPLEDDKRDWSKRLRKILEARAGETGGNSPPIDWNRAESLAADPKGIPVPVMQGAPNVEDLIARAPEVENTIPAGSNYQEEAAATTTAEAPEAPETPEATQASLIEAGPRVSELSSAETPERNVMFSPL
jgi:L,D-transpeptidase ErfK/SrfK